MRAIKDAAMEVVHVFPAAGANVDSASIDLGAGAGKAAPNDDSALEQLMVELESEAVPALVDTKTITFTLKDSADNVTFVAIAAFPTVVVTGAGGVGAAKKKVQFRLPPGTRRYINVNAAVLAAGGDNTAAHFWLRLLF
jgi:hypothetical protein